MVLRGLGVSSGVKVVSSGGGIAKVVVLSGVVAIVGFGFGDIEDWLCYQMIVRLVEIRVA